MPEPTVTSPGVIQDASGWDPPSGDLDLDELFPNPELALQQPTPPAQPATTQPEYFLKASTGTVYRNQEDAIRGTEEKDRTIERLKAQLAATPPTAPATPATPGQPDQKAYAKDIFNRLSAAAQAGDPDAYLNTMAEFQMGQLAPFAPLLSEVAREKAIRAMEPEASDFRTFVNSPEYTRTLEQFPLLKDAIKLAESDPYRAGQLPEFYKLVYRSYTGEHAGERAAQTIAASAPALPPSRPTLTSSTPTLPAVGIPQRTQQFTRDQVLQNRENRREFLKRYEQDNAAALNTSWTNVGL